MKVVQNVHVSIFYTFPEISRKIASRSSRFIVLSNSASPKMVIKIYFNFFRFFSKVLQLFECRRGDPATRNDEIYNYEKIVYIYHMIKYSYVYYTRYAWYKNKNHRITNKGVTECMSFNS